jgi:hypothetical protein
VESILLAETSEAFKYYTKDSYTYSYGSYKKSYSWTWQDEEDDKAYDSSWFQQPSKKEITPTDDDDQIILIRYGFIITQEGNVIDVDSSYRYFLDADNRIYDMDSGVLIELKNSILVDEYSMELDYYKLKDAIFDDQMEFYYGDNSMYASGN